MNRGIVTRRLFPMLVLLLLMTACIAPGTSIAKKVHPKVATSLTQFVNPFVGTAEGGTQFGFTGNSGDTFPGATYPIGMVQWSPDTPANLPGGYYYPDTTIKGFSLTHFSGRGCRAYQDIPFMPYVGAVTTSPNVNPALFTSTFSHQNESAHPGYYSVALDASHVKAELSVTQHTGYGQFTYPASTAATMLINAGGSVRGNTNSQVQINSGANEVTGFSTSTIGCGSSTYTVYFSAQFDRPFSKFGTWNATSVQPAGTSSTSPHSGAFLTFDTTQQQVVHVKVGISFISVANAALNSTSEDATADFATIQTAADAAWNTRLHSIEVTGGTDDEEHIFYTALYHAFLHPNIFNDVNGQYLGFDNKLHSVVKGHAQYENIAGWDQYRSLIQLRALLAPKETSDIAQSLVNDAVQGDGHLPRWEQTNVDSRGMIGDNGSMLIAQAYAFGATGFDTAGALTAMQNGAAKIRDGLSYYQTLGYVPPSVMDGSASVTEEYSADDFATSMYAQALGNTSLSTLYRQRSGNWQHLYNAKSGLIQPRNADGTWTSDFYPTTGKGFVEGSAVQYTWMIPFNVQGLFQKMGGNANAVSRLDTFFTKLNDGGVSQYSFMGNEPGFVAPWEYDFAGAPSHTQRVTRAIETQLFHNTPGGLPGNDDGGATSSWYVFAALGLYPEIPGVGGFVIGSPLFASATVHLAGGHTLQINAPAASDQTPFVQSLSIGNKATTSLWLPVTALKKGATLTFMLVSSATTWGSGVNDAPPSYGA